MMVFFIMLWFIFPKTIYFILYIRTCFFKLQTCEHFENRKTRLSYFKLYRIKVTPQNLWYMCHIGFRLYLGIKQQSLGKNKA